MSDLMAGAIVGIVALPLAIAFAIASGVSPEKGIITAVIAGFIIPTIYTVHMTDINHPFTDKITWNFLTC